MEQREKQQRTTKGRLIDESDFVDQLRSNSEQAWAALLAESWEPMRRMALRICGPQTPPTDIEDILQDTLLAALQNLDRFRGECLFSTFLLAILRHKAADFNSSMRKRHLEYIEYRTLRSQAPERDPAPRRQIAQCLGELIAARQPGSPRRQALELINDSLAGSGNIPSVKEMARLWRCSPQRAKWLWHDTKRILRDHYREVAGDGQNAENLSEISVESEILAAPASHARGERVPCTFHAPGMRVPSITHAPDERVPCITHAPDERVPCISHAPDERVPCISHAPGKRATKGANDAQLQAY